jgi:hypothetical protein
MLKLGMKMPKEGKYLYFASGEESLDQVCDLAVSDHPPTSIIPASYAGDSLHTSEVAGIMKAQYPGKVGVIVTGPTVSKQVSFAEEAQRLGYSPLVFLPGKVPRPWVVGALHFNILLRDDLWYHAPDLSKDRFSFYHLPGYWTTGDWG